MWLLLLTFAKDTFVATVATTTLAPTAADAIDVDVLFCCGDDGDDTKRLLLLLFIYLMNFQDNSNAK